MKAGYNMSKNQCYLDFCTGCGLCHSICGVELKKTEKGFLVPSDITVKQAEYLNDICMCSGAFWRECEKYSVWGPTEVPPFYAFSTNVHTRKAASSGGVLTEIAIYLLRSGYVDGIIQTRASKDSPIRTETVVSTTEEDVLSCGGSRYTVSTPLLKLADLMENGKKYAFIGKPCDVQSIRNWQRKNPERRMQIPYLLSFLCAGVPSIQAEQKLLKSLNTDEATCTKITYRGNGWPGYTVAYSAQGQTGIMSYEDSWGKILGRDVALACRFCFDGIGEAADISCGDGWYTQDGKPDFSENEGRNIVFARTPKGLQILEELKKEKMISYEKSDMIYEELSMIQMYQYVRRITMKDRIAALKMYRRPVPRYNANMMKEFAKIAPFKLRIKIFGGTLKRLHEKKF